MEDIKGLTIDMDKDNYRNITVVKQEDNAERDLGDINTIQDIIQGDLDTGNSLDNKLKSDLVNASNDKEKKLTTNVYLEDYGAIGDGIADDTQSIINAVNDCLTHGYTLCSSNSNAIYTTSQQININDNFSIDLNNARIKAIKQMNCLLYLRSKDTSSFNITIKNIYFDGDIYADVILDLCDCIANCENIVVKNGLTYGIHVHNGGNATNTGSANIYNSIVWRSDNANVLKTDAIGILIETSDGHYRKNQIINFNVGFKCNSTNMFNEMHVWNSNTSILSSCIGFVADGGTESNIMLNQCYFDTCAIMVKIISNNVTVKMNQCTSFYNSWYYTLSKKLPIPYIVYLNSGIDGNNVSMSGCRWNGMYYFGAYFCNTNNNLITTIETTCENVRDFMENKKDFISNFNTNSKSSYINRYTGNINIHGKIKITDGTLNAELINGNFSSTIINPNFTFINGSGSISDNRLNITGTSSFYGSFNLGAYGNDGDLIYISFILNNLNYSINQDDGFSVVDTANIVNGNITNGYAIVQLKGSNNNHLYLHFNDGFTSGSISSMVLVNLTRNKFLFYELETYSQALNRIINLNNTWWEGTRTYLMDGKNVVLVSHPSGNLFIRNVNNFVTDNANFKTVLLNGGIRYYNKGIANNINFDIFNKTFSAYSQIYLQRYVDNPQYLGNSADQQEGGINLYSNGTWKTLMWSGTNLYNYFVSPNENIRLQMVTSYNDNTQLNYDIPLIALHENSNIVVKNQITKNDDFVNMQIYENGEITLSPTIENDLFIANVIIVG